jgi:hypothetical protein
LIALRVPRAPLAAEWRKTRHFPPVLPFRHGGGATTRPRARAAAPARLCSAPSNLLAMIQPFIACDNSAKTGGAGVQNTRKHSGKFSAFFA